MTITTEKVILNKERNVSLVTMIQSTEGEFVFPERPGIVIVPGGGYGMCSDRECEIIAYPYLAAGFDCFVLRYSVAEHRTWPNPLNDYDQAMEYILDHADEWHLCKTKIAAVGFSAGGHLVGSAATLAKHRPNAALLIYAALDQDIASACQPGTSIPSPTEHVDDQTPPCFLAACRDDPLVRIHNTLGFELELEKHNITFESHIYSYGGHGFSLATPEIHGAPISARTKDWVQDSIGFLFEIFGRLTPRGFEEPTCLPALNGNGLPVLNTACTISYLHARKNACPELAAAYAQIESIIVERFGSIDMIDTAFSAYKLSEVLAGFGWSPVQILDLENILRTIPNT